MYAYMCFLTCILYILYGISLSSPPNISTQTCTNKPRSTCIYTLGPASRECHGLPKSFPGQPASVPVEIHAHSHRHRFLQAWAVGFIKSTGFFPTSAKLESSNIDMWTIQSVTKFWLHSLHCKPNPNLGVLWYL